MRSLATIVPVLVAVALAPVAGCGYKLVDYGAGFGGIRSVAIETPTNESYFAGVEYVVADALRREFLRRGGVRVIDDPNAADLVLGGSVSKVKTEGRSFSSIEFTVEFELIMELALEARLRDGSVRPIGERSLIDAEYYLASADIEATRKNRDEAIRRVSGVLAQRVHESLFEAATR